DVREEAHGFWPSRSLRPCVPVIDDADLCGFRSSVGGAPKIVAGSVVIEDVAGDGKVGEDILGRKHKLVVQVCQYLMPGPDVMYRLYAQRQAVPYRLTGVWTVLL